MGCGRVASSVPDDCAFPNTFAAHYARVRRPRCVRARGTRLIPVKPDARIEIRPATIADAPVILAMIRDLADFEHLAHEVEASEERLRDTLFGPAPAAEALLGCVDGEQAGFALFFASYSTFLAKPGLYLEDLFVRAQYRHRGLGTALVVAVARIAMERGCGRYEWSVLDWNAAAIAFYESLGAEMQPGWRRMRIAGSALQSLARRA